MVLLMKYVAVQAAKMVDGAAVSELRSDSNSTRDCS